MENSEQSLFLYLLGVSAYSDDDGSVTQGTVKRALPKEFHAFAQKICDELIKHKYLYSPKRNRVQMTDNGNKFLISLISKVDYKFETAKGARILNALLSCSKQYQEFFSTEIKDEMSFADFADKLEHIYHKKRKNQAIKGVIAIRRQDIKSEFLATYSISESIFDSFFERMKSEKVFFVTIDDNQELINWAE